MRRSSTHDGHGAVTSWPDHILTLQHHSSTIMEVAGVHSACNLSDHVPLAFSVNIDLNYSSSGPSRCPASRSFSCAVDWSRVTSAELDRYIEAIRMNLPVVSADLLDCCDVNCRAHQVSIDVFCNQLLECLQSAASLCLPLRSQRAKAMPGWNEHVRRYKESACLWNAIWVDSGCPRSGILFELRKQTKKAYKYAVRQVKRRQLHIASQKLGTALSSANFRSFWKQVKAMKSSPPSASPVVDGCSNDSNITKNFRAKLANLLNSDDPSRRNALFQEISTQTSPADLEDTFVSEQVVHDSLLSLGLDKSDGTGLSSNHFFVAASVLAAPLADFFTVVLRHGYMPSALRNCVLVPIPKPHKDPSVSDSYRPIALAPNLSKVLEKCILFRYRSCFITSDLQFGFERGFSTELCSGFKNAIQSTFKMELT